MSEEQLTPEQVAEMQAQIDAFNAARRTEAEAVVDEQLGELLDLSSNTLTPELANTLEQASRSDSVTPDLAQLLSAIARCITVLPRSIDGAREREIARLMAGNTGGDAMVETVPGGGDVVVE